MAERTPLKTGLPFRVQLWVVEAPPTGNTWSSHFARCCPQWLKYKTAIPSNKE